MLDLWYKNAVLYCLDVETYMDANGDGIGDLIVGAQQADPDRRERAARAPLARRL